MVAWPEPRYMTRDTTHATTLVMTYGMVLEDILEHMTHATMCAITPCGPAFFARVPTHR